MGEYSTFECEACGYKSRRLRWGVGEDDSRLRFLIGVCNSCKELVEIDLTGRDVLVDTFTCGDCNGTVFFFERSESYDCPSCGAANLRIKQEGYW